MDRIMRWKRLVWVIPLLQVAFIVLPAHAATEEQIEASIEQGIPWLVSNQNSDGSWGGYERVAHTGFAIIKLEDRAFELARTDPTIDGPFDPDYPYSVNVMAGLDYLFQHAHPVTLSIQAAGNPDPGFRPHHYQAMYTMMKGFERMGIDVITVGGSEIDWFDEVSTIIVNSQNLSGSWPHDPWGNSLLSTNWALLTLEKVVPPRTITVFVDIKPQSCPNPLNVRDRGVLPVAILGTEEFDVTTIDPVSVRLLDVVSPLRWAVEDVATPVMENDNCECTTLGPDMYPDLTLKFNTQDVVTALGEIDDGDVVPIMLTGTLDETNRTDNKSPRRIKRRLHISPPF